MNLSSFGLCGKEKITWREELWEGDVVWGEEKKNNKTFLACLLILEILCSYILELNVNVLKHQQIFSVNFRC